MKAIITQIQKPSRPAVMLMTAVVAIITSMVAANATQTITTPNAVKITYNLAAGANSAAITPASNTSVLVMGCCTTGGTTGVGQVSLLHSSDASFGNLIEWVGLESFTFGSPSTITSGFSAAAGTHIVFIDIGHLVDIQMASRDTILIHNGSTATRAGNVTLVW